VRVKDVAFTAYAVTDLNRSRKFYEGVLGLKPTILKEGMPWIEYEIGPATLGIGVSDKWKPSSDGASIAIEVDNFDEAIAELKGKGVEFEMGPLETPVCHMAVLRDPDGSKICIHRRKDHAHY
jgi:catechol 2,3-dioxygenase-like lactoylglutathione lyase family enzyme